MRRLLAALGIIACAFAPQLASAEEVWKLDKFRSDIEVRADGSIDVKETIDVDFLTERHGIYRYIPTQGKDTDGKAYRMSVEQVDVTLDGKSERYDDSRNGDNLVWRIGNPNVTMTGKRQYVIRYTVIGAIGRFTDYDELYWNISGEGWDVPLPNVAATVILPQGVKELQSACYTGAYGSTETDCQIISTGDQVGFISKTAGKAMSVAVSFPKGAIAEIAVPAEKAYDPMALPLMGLWWWILPAVAALFMYRFWKKDGDDPSLGAIVAQYEPPVGLGPAQTTAVLKQTTDQMAIASTIVDLAVRGYIRIEETKTEGLLGTGLGASKSHILHLLKDYHADPSIKPFETSLLEAMFTGKAPTHVSISDLVKENFYEDSKEFRTSVMRHLTLDGYFDGEPDKARVLPMAFGLMLMAIPGFMLIGAPWLIVSWPGAALATGAVIAGFGYFMSKWSAKGIEAAKQAAGYKEFISKVEKYRAPWMETQEIFEKTLPYAMAFGLGSRWAKAFESLNIQPPNWYAGAHMGAWSAMSFANDIDGWSKSMVAASSPPRSSGSGSGGGGFSGGGGGGGGGGSW